MRRNDGHAGEGKVTVKISGMVSAAALRAVRGTIKALPSERTGEYKPEPHALQSRLTREPRTIQSRCRGTIHDRRRQASVVVRDGVTIFPGTEIRKNYLTFFPVAVIVFETDGC